MVNFNYITVLSRQIIFFGKPVACYRKEIDSIFTPQLQTREQTRGWDKNIMIIASSVLVGQHRPKTSDLLKPTAQKKRNYIFPDGHNQADWWEKWQKVLPVGHHRSKTLYLLKPTAQKKDTTFYQLVGHHCSKTFYVLKPTGLKKNFSQLDTIDQRHLIYSSWLIKKWHNIFPVGHNRSKAFGLIKPTGQKKDIYPLGHHRS